MEKILKNGLVQKGHFIFSSWDFLRFLKIWKFLAHLVNHLILRFSEFWKFRSKKSNLKTYFLKIRKSNDLDDGPKFSKNLNLKKCPDIFEKVPQHLKKWLEKFLLLPATLRPFFKNGDLTKESNGEKSLKNGLGCWGARPFFKNWFLNLRILIISKTFWKSASVRMSLWGHFSNSIWWFFLVRPPKNNAVPAPLANENSGRRAACGA